MTLVRRDGFLQRSPMVSTSNSKTLISARLSKHKGILVRIPVCLRMRIVHLLHRLLAIHHQPKQSAQQVFHLRGRYRAYYPILDILRSVMWELGRKGGAETGPEHDEEL